MKDMCAIDVDKMDIYNMAVVYAWTTYKIYTHSDLLRTDGQRQIPGIVVDNTEVTIRINGIHTAALLDTGSTVSTICESF